MSEAKYERKIELLKKAADALKNGSDPFNHGWLSENEVTLDECFSLSELMASILNGWIVSDKEVRLDMIALSAVSDDPALVECFKASLKMGRTLKKLKPR